MTSAKSVVIASCLATVLGAGSASAATAETEQPIASLQHVSGKVLVNYAAVDASTSLKSGDLVLVSDGATATAVFKDCQIVVPSATANTVEELYNLCTSANVQIAPTADKEDDTEVGVLPLFPIIAGGLLAGGIITTVVILNDGGSGGDGGDGGVSDPN